MIPIWSVESSTHTYIHTHMHTHTHTHTHTHAHTHTYVLKTRISWYCDFSWWSISSTCRAIACPGHISFISMNQPFMYLSILQPA